MPHTITHREINEWEEEICDNCGHPVYHHYDQPLEVCDFVDGSYVYTAIGCMILEPDTGRQLPGNNPFLRCNCLHSE